MGELLMDKDGEIEALKNEVAELKRKIEKDYKGYKFK